MNTKNKLFALLVVMLAVSPLSLSASATNVYAVSNIPPELLVSANAVIRHDQMEYVVNASGARQYVKTAITLLNNHSDFEVLRMPYDQNSQIKKLQARIYDAAGSLVRKIAKAEIKDYSAVSDVSLYEDNRLKYIDFNHSEYPYTIEYEYETSQSEVLFYPRWRFVPGFNISVQYSSLKLVLADGKEVDYKTYNCDYEPEVSVEGDTRTFLWEQKNLRAIQKEPLSPATVRMGPVLILVPERVEAAGVSGDLSNWKAYGDFMYRLNANRDELSRELLTEVRSLIADASSEAEKIEILYRYVQENMRYVSVQLGIGGWQTFEADYVEKHKYGDCKALTNFMKALLKAADIQAYMALVYGGDQPLDLEADFPGPGGFNHVILHIPSENYWLECTSKKAPVNYLGSFTSNRKALLLTEEGGKLVKTPLYTAEDNTQKSAAEISVKADGSAVIRNSVHSFGLRYDEYNHDQNEYREDDLKRWFVSKNKQLPAFKINELSLRTSREKAESGVDYEIAVKRFATKAGKRLMVPVNMLNGFDQIPPPMDDRRFPVEIEEAYTDDDEYRFTLPDGFKVESLPEKEKELRSDFGSYQLSIRQEGNVLHYRRKLVVRSGRFSPERYSELRDFYKQLARLDQMKLVLVRKKT